VSESMCFSKRRTKQIKLCILATSTESVLLLMYLALYLATLVTVNEMQSDYSMRQDLLFYFSDPWSAEQPQKE